MKYVFLIDQDNDYETIYNAIPADKIETIKVTDTYNHYGQAVSPEEAGSSVILNTNKAVESANLAMADDHDDSEVLTKYQVGDYVNAHDQSDVYSAIIKECEEDKDYTLQIETCEGFNFWDGNNWKSVIIKYENNDYYTGWELLDNKKLELELNEAIEKCEYVSEGFGVKNYETNEYVITQSAFASDWSTYQIKDK